MSVRAYEAIIPLHQYDLRASQEPAPQLALYCLQCGLALTAWSTAAGRHPPGLDVVVRTARDHELSAHPRPGASLIHRPAGDRGER